MNYLIVGGGTGIGSVITKELVAKGHKVIVVSRSATEKVERSESVHPIDLDATDTNADWDFLPDELHGIAYCAGSINLKPFNRFKPEDFDFDFRVNAMGAVNTVQKALPKLKAAGSASVVFFSSVAAQRGLTFHTSVSAAKGAVEGLTRALSAELAPNIRVNALALSLTDTPMAERLLNNESKREAGMARHPLKRYGKPEDAGKLAAFLLSEDTSWITGQVIGVDGGMSTIQSL